MIRWINDPFKKENIYTVGLETNNLSDDRKLILPDYKVCLSKKNSQNLYFLLEKNTYDSILE